MPRHPSRARGFTLLEILVSMAIFTVLGSMVIVFMRQSLDIFYAGTKESGQLDRMDTALPQVRADLESMTIPADFTPPRPPPTEDELLRMGKEKPKPSPAVKVRLRSGTLVLRNTGDDRFKDYPCPYIAFVTTDASEWSDKFKRRAGEAPKGDGELKALTPETVVGGDRDTRYQATGGLMEVLWIAVPQDLMEPPENGGPAYPAILTLYRGFRSPIGDPEKSLLDPEHFDERDEILKACRPVARGLIHFGATWRRSIATSWDTELGVGLGELAPYVGPDWDSTRALIKGWPLDHGPQSLSDPSDDIFPAFVMLEATFAAPTQFGMGRGELRLTDMVPADEMRLKVDDPDKLMQPNLGRQRWLKVDAEWMAYELGDVDWEKKEVRVRRGQRGTQKMGHESGAWIYVGAPSQLQMRLPVYRDVYVLREEQR